MALTNGKMKNQLELDFSDSKYPPTRPFMTIPPPRPPAESLLAVYAIPSPMTIVNNFFADNPDFRGSFSQLLAGAMASPSPLAGTGSLLGDNSSVFDRTADGNAGEGSGLGFKQNRPVDLMVPVQAPVSPLFPISPGFTPSAFLNSPDTGFFAYALDFCNSTSSSPHFHASNKLDMSSTLRHRQFNNSRSTSRISSSSSRSILHSEHL